MKQKLKQNVIQEIRNNSKLQQQIADDRGVKLTTINQAIYRKELPSWFLNLETLSVISNFLKCRIETLIEHD